MKEEIKNNVDFAVLQMITFFKKEENLDAMNRILTINNISNIETRIQEFDLAKNLENLFFNLISTRAFGDLTSSERMRLKDLETKFYKAVYKQPPENISSGLPCMQFVVNRLKNEAYIKMLSARNKSKRHAAFASRYKTELDNFKSNPTKYTCSLGNTKAQNQIRAVVNKAVEKPLEEIKFYIINALKEGGIQID